MLGVQRPLVQLHEQQRAHRLQDGLGTGNDAGLAAIDIDLDHVNFRQAMPCDHRVERLQGHAFGTGANDIVVGDFASNQMETLLGNGDGTLQSAENYGSGANPAANCTLTDADFVAARYRVVQTREPVASTTTA